MDKTRRPRRQSGRALALLLAALALGLAAACGGDRAPSASEGADERVGDVVEAAPGDAPPAVDDVAPNDAEPPTAVAPEPPPEDAAPPTPDVVAGDETDDADVDPWASRRRDLLIEVTEPEQAAFLHEFGVTVGERRGLPLLAEVPVFLLRRADLAAYFTSLYEVEDLEEAAFAESTYRLLGIIDRDTEYFALVQDLFVGLVLGFYDEDVDAFIVVSSNDQVSRNDLDTISHEFIHALQDQHFDLGARFDDTQTTDADTAFSFILEGDARLSESLFQDLVRALGPTLPPTVDRLPGAGSVPAGLRRLFNAPYTLGLEAVRRIVSQGGPNAIDPYIAQPPASTEQLLHPEKLEAGEAPLSVPPPDLLAALPGWEEVGTDTLGEFVVRTILERAVGAGAAAAAAAGWGGDALTLYENGAGGEVLAWHTRWDTPADAEEFRLALETWMRATVGGDAVRGDDASYAVRDGEVGAWSLAEGAAVALLVGDARTVEALAATAPGELLRAATLDCDAQRMAALMSTGKDGSVVAETPCFAVAY